MNEAREQELIRAGKENEAAKKEDVESLVHGDDNGTGG